MGPGERGQDGLIYYSGDYGNLNAGQTFNTSLNYIKDSDTLTATSLTVDPISPIDESAQGRSRLMSSLPWVFGGLGLILLFGGGLWYWQSGRNKAEQTRRPRHKPAAPRPASANQSGSTSQEHIYCSQCGKRGGPGDRFCRPAEHKFGRLTFLPDEISEFVFLTHFGNKKTPRHPTGVCFDYLFMSNRRRENAWRFCNRCCSILNLNEQAVLRILRSDHSSARAPGHQGGIRGHIQILLPILGMAHGTLSR